MANESRTRHLTVAGALGAMILLALLAGSLVRRVSASDPPSLRVAAAVSLRPALEELARAFEDESGREVGLSYGSSGQIVGQIRGGAPVDVFISAAPEQMARLSRDGLIEAGSLEVIAENELVLIVPPGADHAPSGFAELGGENVERLAIGEPRTVPAGAYARQVLERLGLLEAVRGRLVYGTNVRQVLSYVERGEVSAGIVYRTDAVASGTAVRVVEPAEGEWHDRVEYPAGIVTGSRNREVAEAFLAFLRTARAGAVLERHGFRLPAESGRAVTALP
jgi:molybdate transport system substrate-binding protein